MSGIEDRIAAVIAEHHTVYHGSAACRCGKFSAGSVDFDGHDAHVAAAVVAELQLTQQWSVEMDLAGGRIRTEPTPFPPRGDLAYGDVTLSRWVTGWEKAE